MARLLYRDSQGREGTVELSPTETVYIGRGVECAIRTDDGMVSRRHARIWMEDGQYVVADLDSANGTHLNNKPILWKQALSHADVLQCGSLMIRFLDEGAVNILQQPVPVAAAPPPKKGGTLMLEPGGGPAGGDAPPRPAGFGSPSAVDPHGGAADDSPAAPGMPYGGPPSMPAAPGMPYGGPPSMPGSGPGTSPPGYGAARGGVFGGSVDSKSDAAPHGGPPGMPSSGPPAMPGTPYGGPPGMPGAGSGATRADNASMFGRGGPMGPVGPAARPADAAENKVLVDLGLEFDPQKADAEIKSLRAQLEKALASYEREVADGKYMRAQLKKALASAPVAPQFVNLGFAAPDAAGTPLVDRTLGAGEWYVFWVEIQPQVIAGSAGGAVAIGDLHDGDTLDVILFGFPRQLRIGPARHGRVQIRAGGNRVVQPAWPETPDAVETTRLCFAVRTPWTFGRAALRCNIYHRGILLQSHLVSAEVTWSGRDRPGAVSRVCDYNLSTSLDTHRLGSGTEHLLSVLINDDGHGTHSFRFVASNAGVPELIHDGHLDGTLLAEAVGYARKALQWVAWGAEEDWDSTRHTYRFTTSPDRPVMEAAYKLLAVRGANLWGQIITQFGFLGPDARALRETMRRPGRVQIALKMSPDAVVPMAMVYDYPLDPARKNLALCEVSSAAIAAGKPLEHEPCFLGSCPHYEDDHVVCAGGFWGFRHELGLPIHLPRGEVATTIARGAAARGFAPISTDPSFVQRSAHLAALAALATDWLEVIDDRDTCIQRLVGETRPLIYFYCHGGLTRQRTPFLEVGAPGSDMITAQTFIDKFLHWSEPTRPLVILNGCHTTATSPEAMFSLLAALAWQANAAGVIGTEITNFEPIAVQVGTELVSRFLAGEEVGRAVKLARLRLLCHGNPLGLMYIPFALPTLHLV